MSANKFVLCVEDEPDIGLLLKGTLRGLPVEVMISPNAIVALEEMEKRRPDLIVLDLMLPRMSGLDFLEQVREREEWRDVPVIVLTVRSGSESRKRSKDLKAAIYMTKPFVPKELQQVVSKLLGLEDADV